jgi:GT2 family glycosyltransferase
VNHERRFEQQTDDAANERDDVAPRVVAVVVAWNHWEDTAECLRSLADVSYPSLRVLLVDNGSTDGTSDSARRLFPQVDVISNERNLGLACAYNAGMRAALGQGAKYILILNNDTAIEPDALSELVRVCEQASGSEVGAVMPRILYYSHRDRIWSSGARERRFPPGIVFEELGSAVATASMQEKYIEFAPSCVLLLRAQAIVGVGLFDESYFFYYDDWDLCERIRLGGWRIRLAPHATVYHKVSVSTEKSASAPRWWQIKGESSVRFYLRYRSVPLLLATTVWVIVRELVKGNPREAIAYGVGVRSALISRRVREAGA